MHDRGRRGGGAKGVQRGDLATPTFWVLMFFIINDSEKKLTFTIACAKSLWTKQASYCITRLNLVYIIGTKQHSDCIFHRNYVQYGKWEYHLISRYIHFLQWNISIADIPNRGHAMNNGQNVKSQMWQSFLNYLPIAHTSQ